MSTIYFKDYRRMGYEVLEKECSFGDFRVIDEEEKEGDCIYRKISFIHKVEIEDKEIEKCFLNIIKNKYSYEECKGKCCKSDIDGSITPVREFFSKDFQDFCNNEEDFLEQTIIRFFDNALWIYKSSEFFLNDNRRHWIYFSFDKKEWRLVPIRPVGGLLGQPFTENEFNRLENEVKVRNKELARCLVESMNNGQIAPIYSRIYYEAVNYLSKNPQTAIVLAVESVEVAAKNCISYFDENAKWLIDNVPTPPLEKILKEYVTVLIPKGMPPIPKELINRSLHDAVIARNKTVHSGVFQMKRKEANVLIKDLGRILAYLEYYMGCDWAKFFFDRPFNHWFFI